MPTTEAVMAALAGVEDPEIRRPITELGMVKAIDITASGVVRVEVFLTIAACPMRTTLLERVDQAVAALAGVTAVEVEFDVMSDEQRSALREKLQGPSKEIPFAKPGSLTKVLAVASGKGGVGKSSVTVNLAVELAAPGATSGSGGRRRLRALHTSDPRSDHPADRRRRNADPAGHPRCGITVDPAHEARWAL